MNKYNVHAWGVLERHKGTGSWKDLMGSRVRTVLPQKLPTLFNTRKEARDSARMTWNLESDVYRKFHCRPTVIRVKACFLYDENGTVGE